MHDSGVDLSNEKILNIRNNITINVVYIYNYGIIFTKFRKILKLILMIMVLINFILMIYIIL